MNKLNISRILKFALSIFAFFIAYFEHSIGFVFIGAYFALLGVFNWGCSGNKACAINQTYLKENDPSNTKK